METVIRFVKSKYFSLPGIAWILLICIGVYALVGSAFFPHYVPIEYFGPLGSLSKFFKERNIMNSACLSIEKEIEQFTRVKWILSTMCFGGFSLYELDRYQPEKIIGDVKTAIPTEPTA